MKYKLLSIFLVLLLALLLLAAKSNERQLVIWPHETGYVYCHNGYMTVREYPNTIQVKCFEVEQ